MPPHEPCGQAAGGGGLEDLHVPMREISACPLARENMRSSAGAGASALHQVPLHTTRWESTKAEASSMEYTMHARNCSIVVLQH